MCRARLCYQLTHWHNLSLCANAQLLAEGELAPGLSAAEFADRRARLACLLPPGSVAIVPGAAKNYRTGAIPYPYRQVRVRFAALLENIHECKRV